MKNKIKIPIKESWRKNLIEKKSEKIRSMTPSLFSSVKKLFKDKEFIKILIIFLIFKLIIIGVATSSLLIPREYVSQKEHIDGTFLNLFAQYDSRAYLDIAKNGYNKEFGEGIGNYSYFPLYPLLTKIFSYLFGIGWSAFLVSNLLSFICVILLYLIIKEDFGQIIAKKSVMYFILFPVAYFFTMMYTESLFFVLMLLMFYYARRDSWLLVGIFGFFACLTRMFGIILFFPMLYMYLNNRKFKKIDYKILYLCLIPLGILAFFSFFYFTTGDFFIAFKTFAKPEYSFKPLLPGLSFIYAFFEIFKTTSLEAISYILINLFFGIFFVFASILSFKIRKEYGIFMVFYLILAISHTSLSANIRYYMLMFPAYIYVAQIKNKNINKLLPYILTIFILLMILFTIRHVNTSVDFIGLGKNTIEKF